MCNADDSIIVSQPSPDAVPPDMSELRSRMEEMNVELQDHQRKLDQLSAPQLQVVHNNMSTKITC